MRTQVIRANSVDEAVERILGELKEDTAIRSGRPNIIYFNGWDGLGASAVLRAISQCRLTPEAGSSRATPAAGLGFSRIFHIDCSKWESRRAMQRMVAEQLELPASVKEMFDAQDEEDDYQGVAKGSRTELPQVTEAIYQHIQIGAIYEPNVTNRKFLVIFHNGSSEEIDLGSIGFPLSELSRNKVLWSFQGRFRLYPRKKVNRALKNTRMTGIFLSAALFNDNIIGEDEMMPDILRHEAEEVARGMVNTGSIGIDWPAAVISYFWYVMKLHRMGSDYDMPTHASNYWRCDDMIQLQQGDVGTDEGVDWLWQSSDALHREIQLDSDHYRNPYLPSLVGRRLHKRMACWASPTYGFMLIPDGYIHIGMFQQFDKLSVLKLSACTFSFTSPPFLCCHNIRFLWLDHCRDGSSSAAEAVEKKEEEDCIRWFFQRLWVLDVRYSNAFLSMKMIGFMTQLRELNVMGEDDLLVKDMFLGRLNNIRKLRVIKSSGSLVPFFTGTDKSEHLEFSDNTSSLYNLAQSSCSSLETVIISGATWFYSISLSRCAKLKNLFLSGSFRNLVVIEIVGAALEILDLRAVTARGLSRLYLFDCEKLCAILWPPAEGRRIPEHLHIHTTKKEDIATDASEERPPTKFHWHFSVRDARILGSFEPVKDYFGSHSTHVEIFSSPCNHPSADAVGSKDGGIMWNKSGQHVQVKLKLKQPLQDAAVYADVAATLKEGH